MTEYKLRYEDKETGCVYCWDEERDVWDVWTCISSVKVLPLVIRAMVLADKKRAEAILKLPL